MNFNQLRTRHAQFIYEGFSVLYEDGNLKIIFDFLLAPDIKFKPTVIFPNVTKKPKGLENLIFNLGMVELLSYWKAACPKQIVVKAGYLNEEQIKFWKNLLIKGLGEFFYTNKINFTKEDLVTFKVRSHMSSAKPFNGKLKDRDLILVGGGKDSAVTLGMMGRGGREFNCLTLNPTNAALKICKLGRCDNPIIIKRTIDPKLLELNKKGYLNGHTPFSAYLAFLSTLAAVIYDYKNIIVSNEASADEANVEWLGQQINHQYSKSSKFEQDFRSYSEKYLAPTNYFSFLRSLGELQISEIFSKIPKYHKVFRSCNKRSLPANAGRGSKLGVWCGRCPKCVSTYLTLYPYLGEKTKEIFNKDLLNDESLIPTVLGLLRENNVVKPFECVATIWEIKKAISMGRMRAKKDKQPIPKLLQIKI